MEIRSAHEAERSSVCNKIENRYIMTVSETAEIELFCDVVSGILDRITKESSRILEEASHQEG